MGFSVESFRKNFPQLNQQINGQSLVYFDNGASTLKAQSVAERVYQYDLHEVSNVHRGAHTLSRKGTENYEAARLQVAQFLNAARTEEVVFTRGTTEALNLIATCVGQTLQRGDEIIVSAFEHHSNIVPWQQICEKLGCVLKVLPWAMSTHDMVESLKELISPKTRVVSVLHYSNSLGHRLPVEEMGQICRDKKILFCVDGAQALLSEVIDVQKINCDFYCFSGHKVFAPYGIGALYARAEVLETLAPYQSGGSMVDRVSFAKTTFADIPQKFEAGTPNVSGAIGLGTALAMIRQDGVSNYHDHILGLRQQLIQGLDQLDKVKRYEILSTDYCGAVSFNIEGAHPTDVGTLLDQYGIAVRAGHHCTQPLMDQLGVPGTVRASLAPYNTAEEVDLFLNKLKKVEEFF